MGLFDDLIPNQEAVASTGLFDDLIPQAPETPVEAGGLSSVLDQVMQVFDPATFAGEDLAIPQERVIPEAVPTTSLDQIFQQAISRNPNAPRPLLTGPGEEQGPMPLEDPVVARETVVDNSSLAGDFEAGLLQLGQIIPGIRAAGAVNEVRVGLSDTLPVDKELQELDIINAKIDDLKTSLSQRMPSDKKKLISEELLSLGSRKGQLELLVGDGAGQEFARAGVAEADQGLETLTEVLPEIASKTAQISEIPMNPAAEEVGSAGTFGEGLQSFLKDPVGVARTFSVRSLPVSAPSIGAGILGMVLGGPAVSGAAAGLVGASTEFGASASQGIEQALKDAGVDITDADALDTFMRDNPDVMSDIVGKSLVRAGIIGSFDALTGGLSGAIARTASKAGKGTRIAGIGAGGVLEAGGEGAGEAAAMQVTDGKIAPGEVIAEIVGGGAPGAVTTAGQIAVEVVKGKNKGAQGVKPEEATVDPETSQTSPDPAKQPVSDEIKPKEPNATEGSDQTDAPAVDAPDESKPIKGDHTTVFTPDNEPIEVETEVVEADSLITSDQEGFPQELQPRDRDRAASETQIEGIANNIIPQRLDQSSETDRGSPIINENGVVESGNGRTIAIRRAFERGKAEEYRQFIIDQFPEAANMNNPILVRRRITKVDAQQFTAVSNAPATLQMSATENAKSDARLIDDGILSKFKGGNTASVGNRDMIRSFIAKLPKTVQGALTTTEGGLSVEGQTRFQNAIFHRAFGDDRLLARLSESTDDDMRSVTNALLDNAGRIAQMKLAIERGEVSPDVDVTHEIVRAIEEITGFRSKGMDLKGFRSQIDAFAEQINDTTELIMSAFFNKEGTRMASKKAISDFLNDYAAQALEQKIDQGTLDGVEEAPVKAGKEIVENVASKEPQEETGSLFETSGTESSGQGNDQGRDNQQSSADGGKRKKTSAKIPERVKTTQEQRDILSKLTGEDVGEFDFIAWTSDHFVNLNLTDEQISEIANAQLQFIEETSPEIAEKLDAELEAQSDIIMKALRSKANSSVVSLEAVRKISSSEKAFGSLEGDLKIQKLQISLFADGLSLSARDEKIIGSIYEVETPITGMITNASDAKGDTVELLFDDFAEWAVSENIIRKTRNRFLSTDQATKPTAKKSGSLAEQEVPVTRVGRRPTGKLSPTFTKFSFNERPSVYQSALADAGIDPDDARLMDVDEQITKISKMIENKFGVKIELPKVLVNKKNKFGRKVTVERQSLINRKALDQLLDAYQNMQMLAGVMGLPEKSIGLAIDGEGITLSLVGKNKLQGMLGMFSYGSEGRVISLAERSNSFAHEWGHALDHYLGSISDPDSMQSMLTRQMSEDGVDPELSPIRAVTDAFAHVMWSMFGENTPMGTLALQLTVEASQVGKDGQPTNQAKISAAILKDLSQGKQPPKKYMSKYFRSSEQFDQMFNAGGYFTDPAEMFARAFEAYIGKTVSALTDLPQSFLTKGGWAYDDSNDARLQLTFPKEMDSEQFAIAMAKLGQSLMSLDVFGEGEKAKLPLDVDVYSNNALLKQLPKTSVFSQEVEEMRKVINRVRNALKFTTAREALLSAGRGLRRFYQQVINTTGAAMYAVADRQTSAKAKQAFLNITTKLAKRPGSGVLQGDIYQEQVEVSAKKRLNKIQRSIKKHFGKKAINPKETDNLKLLLSGEKPKTDANLRKLAGDLRGILNEIWFDLQQAGINVGYAKDFLPHIYDVQKIDKNKAGFLTKATEVYGILFEREVTENSDREGQAEDLDAIISGLKNARVSTVDGDSVSAPRLTQDAVDAINEWRSAKSQITKMKARLKKAKNKDKAQTNLDSAEAAEVGVREELMDVLKPLYAEHAAEKWNNALGVGQMNDYGSVGPTASFLKGRVLPKEAGVILSEFMQDNPIELIQGYAFAAARRAEFAKIFGADGQKLTNMLKAARDAGATEDDIDIMKMAVNAATGRMLPAGRGWTAMRTFTFTLGNIGMLGLAVFTSLTESTVVGMRTGRMRDGLKAFIDNITLMFRTGKKEELKELARTIGLIAPYSMETVMENRLGADAMNSSPSQQQLLQKFFIVNGLTPLTQYQRVAGLPVAHTFLMKLLRDSVKGKRTINSGLRDVVAGGRGEFANNELNELGVAAEDRADLLDWLETVGDIPIASDLYGPDQQLHPAAEIYARATNRFMNEVIQNPLKTDRPIMANHPDYAAVYGIMSFIDGFHRNILLRNLFRGMKEGDSLPKKMAKGTANTALALAPFGVLLAGHVLSTTLREFMMNGDKWDEKEKAGELEEWILQRAFWRTGIAGRFDPLAQTINGVKYQRDLTAITAGPYLGYMLQNMMKIISATNGRNSKNTNTAEHTAVAAAYQLLLQPALAAGLSTFGPAGPLSVNASRLALLKVSAYDTKNEFADALVGEKRSKHQGTAPWWELGH